jgi:hypothetical protein
MTIAGPRAVGRASLTFSKAALPHVTRQGTSALFPTAIGAPEGGASENAIYKLAGQLPHLSGLL